MIQVDVKKITLLKAVELAQLYFQDQLSSVKVGEIAPIPYLAGPPGIGKSSIMRAVVSQLKAKDGRKFVLKTEHPALRPLEMFSGIPEIVKNERGELITKWTKPELLDIDAEENYVIWLWDDVHLMDVSQAKYGFELFTYRKLHNYRIPDNVIFCLAGNHSKEAGAKTMLSPIINRTGIFYVTMTVEDWVDAYINGMSLEEKGVVIIEIDPDKVVEPHPSVVSFLLKNPEFAVEKEDNKSPFGTYRSWTFIGRILSLYEELIAPHKDSSEINRDIRTIVEAHATPKAASEFENYYRIYIKFDPDEVVVRGKKIYNYSSDRMERAVEIFASLFSTTKYVVHKIEQALDNTNGKKEMAKAREYFSNYISYFNEVYKRYGNEPGVTGALVRSLSYLKKNMYDSDNSDMKKLFSASIMYPKPEKHILKEVFDHELVMKRWRAVRG